MTQDPPEDNSDDDSGFRITRRDALIGAATGAAFSSMSNTVAASGNTVYNGIDNLNEGEMYYQFDDGHLNELVLENQDNDVIMSLDYDEMTDDYIVGELALGINGGSPEIFAEHTDYNVDPSGGTVTFTQTDLWGSTDPFDLGQTNQIDDDLSNLGIDVPQPGDDPEKVWENQTDFTIELRIISSNGTINEQKTIEFSLFVAPAIGFGVQFGKYYGANLPGHWPDSGENYP